MSVVLKGPEGIKDAWKVWRTVHIVGYHPKERRVESLFQHHIENMLESQENFLYSLHLGNVSAELLPGWPMPHHIDEPKLQSGSQPFEYKNKKSLLDKIYGSQFKIEGEDLICKAFLVEWDSLFSITPEKIYGYNQCNIVREFPLQSDSYTPFTILKFGPFTKKGSFLIHYRTTLKSNTYNEVIGDEPVFTVDGPESILLRMKREYVNRCPSEQIELTKKHLESFSDYIISGGSYDHIIINGPRNVNPVKVIWKSGGIIKAPPQPPTKVMADRYITQSPRFVLACEYTDKKINIDSRASLKLIA